MQCIGNLRNSAVVNAAFPHEEQFTKGDQSGDLEARSSPHMSVGVQPSLPGVIIIGTTAAWSAHDANPHRSLECKTQDTK